MSLPILLLLVAGLLTVISLLQRLAGRLSLPASILFAVVGIVIGTLARGVVDLPVGSGTFRAFRLAHFLHRRFQIDRPFADRLGGA